MHLARFDQLMVVVNLEAVMVGSFVSEPFNGISVGVSGRITISPIATVPYGTVELVSGSRLPYFSDAERAAAASWETPQLSTDLIMDSLY